MVLRDLTLSCPKKSSGSPVFRRGQLLAKAGLSAIALPLAMGLFAGQATAQQASVDESATTEIVVTAQRRSEGIEKVPISVAAFSEATLTNLKIENTTELQFATPGITNTSTAGDGISAVFIRGVGTGYSGPGLEGSVAFYLDDVYLQTQTSSAQNTVDISQVQVLKGPQGTLYGRNATGGAVVVTTADPRFDKVEGYVQGGYGNLDWARVEGVVNVPLSSTLAVRAAGFFERRDGYVHNIAFPGEEPSGVGAGKTYSGRLKLAWQPMPDLEVIGTASYDRRNGNGAIHSLRYNPDGTPTTLGFYETMQSPAREGGGGDDTDGLLTSLRAQYTTGDWTVSNTFAYRRTRAFGCTDNDGVPAELLYFCTVSQMSPNPGTADGKRDDTITNEFRVVSNSKGPLNVTAGLFFEDNNARFVGRIGGAFFPAPPPGTGTLTPTFDNHDNLTAYSAYLEAYYNFTDQLKLTAGGRYTHEKKRHSVLNDNDAITLFGVPVFDEDETSFNNFSPRAVLSYDAGTMNYYASYSQGFKSGGFNSPALTIDPPLKPEKIDAFEGGAKYRSADGKLRVSGAAFYYNWRDVQVAFITGGGAGITQQNAAGVHIYGAELNVDASPIPALQLSAGLAYTHSRFSSFPNAAVYDIIGGTLQATAEDLEGFRTPQAPDWTANGAATYSFPLGDWGGTVTAAARYTSEYDFTAGAGGELRASRQKPFTLVNLTGTFVTPAKNLEFGWFVKNLLDEKYISLISTGNTGVYMTPDEPRTYGGTIRYTF
jgi:iron complex outermembrane receptor protein